MATLNQNDWVEVEGQTIGAVTADLLTYSIPPASSTQVYARAVLRSTTGLGSGLRLIATISRNGSSAPLVDFVQVTNALSATFTGANITIVASGNNLILRVTGVIALTINWMVRAEPKTYTP